MDKLDTTGRRQKGSEERVSVSLKEKSTSTYKVNNGFMCPRNRTDAVKSSEKKRKKILKKIQHAKTNTPVSGKKKERFSRKYIEFSDSSL